MQHVELGSSEALDMKQLLTVLVAFKKGDFSARLPIDRTGLGGKVADTLNAIMDLQDRTVREYQRLSGSVGKEGKTGQRAAVDGAVGGWAASVEAVNALITDLVQPTNEAARVIGAVAKGDLTQRMALEVEGRALEGEFLRTARVVNGMVEQLGTFAAEVTRVAREVGTEGKVGGQADVKG